MNSESQDSVLGSLVSLAQEVSPEIERACLQLVVDGFERWKNGGFQRFGDHEDHYTVRIVACMKEIRRERNMALVPRFQHVEPSDDMLQGLEDPSRAPRIDMVVAWDRFTDDAYLSIECKRLTPGDLCRRYVVEGIARFVRGYYGAKSNTGAMVGYVVSGTAAAVLDRVNAQVRRASSMGPREILTASDPIEWLSTVYTSNHPRPSTARTIRLTHLFFEMSEIGPSP